MQDELIGPEILDTLLLDPQSSVVIEAARGIAEDHIGTEHLLYGLLETDRVQEVMTNLGIDPKKLQTTTKDYIKVDPNSPETQGQFTQTTLNAIAAAEQERQLRGGDKVLPDDILVGMLRSEVGMGFLLIRNALYGDHVDDSLEARQQMKEELLQRVRAAVTVQS